MGDKLVVKKNEKVDEVITGVYRVNLHCPECASKIKKSLLRTQGVQSVEYELEKNEIKVKGVIEVTKIHKQIQTLSKKKVELIPPQPLKIKEKEIVVSTTTQNKPKQIVTKTTSIKVHLHCDKCELDLRDKLLKHPGIHSVKTDYKAQSVTVEGPIEADKLLAYMRKKVHKHAQIIPPKPEVIPKITKINVVAEVIEDGKKIEPKTKKTDTPYFIHYVYAEVIEDGKKIEPKTKETDIPYFIHYVYAPQLFSDENPNACSII